MKKATKKEMYDLLKTVVDHFSKNPEELRSTTGCYCKYFPPESKPKSIGCAIGMFIPWEDEKKWKKLDGLTVNADKVIDLLPDSLKSFDKWFLRALQDVHDYDSNWNIKGLSNSGKERVSQIKTRIKNNAFN